MKPEFEIVKEFTHKLGLENQKDGILFIYNTRNKELRERKKKKKTLCGILYVKILTKIN